MEEKKYVAKTIHGLEDVLAAELSSKGIKNIQAGRRMVEFTADTKSMYNLNYSLYTALRILESKHSFTFTDVNDYYENIRSIEWKEFLGADNTFALDASVFKCNAFNNSHFTEMKTKDAVADYFRDSFGRRPSVSLNSPDLLINIYITGDFCHVSLDTSGSPLYKRGYREVLHEAPLNEVLAAGMIRLSCWNGEGIFYDPMCGGATIPIEAAMFAARMPSGFFREKWGFMNWKTFQPQLWKQVKEEYSDIIPIFNFSIYASDASSRSIQIARKNIARSRMMKTINLEQTRFEQLKPKGEKGILIFNPPYNIRLEVEDLIQVYKTIGNHLKHGFKGHRAWIISSDMTAIKHIGLKPSHKFHVMNGQMESRFHGFDMY